MTHASLYVFLISMLMCGTVSKFINNDFPLEDCGTDEIDLLIVDIINVQYWLNPPSYTTFINNYSEKGHLLQTIAGTFFENGLVIPNPRVQFAFHSIHFNKSFFRYFKHKEWFIYGLPYSADRLGNTSISKDYIDSVF